MIRIACAGDVHAGLDSGSSLGEAFADVADHADALLLAGDLTRAGLPEEAAVLAEVLETVPVPVVAVLGNHDHHSDRPDEVSAELEAVGVRVLEGDHHVLSIDGRSVGVAGGKGFGGGFWGASATPFGEPEMKAFIRTTHASADALDASLSALETDVRIVLLHYAPIPETLRGEPTEIYPFLGSYLFAEVADRVGADLIVHGHAHRGTEWGATPGGIRVRNVAQSVIRRAYAVYAFRDGDATSGQPSALVRTRR